MAENTIVVYTSDQGFFLGDHGWFDKRLMYEQSLGMPLVIRWPAEITAGTRCQEMIINVDFAATFLDMCGLDPDVEYQRHWGPAIVWLGATGGMSGSLVWGPGVACLGAAWGS